MTALHDAIIARLPATMQELSDATGVKGQELWGAVQMMRQAGIIRRYGPHGHRRYELVAAPAPMPEQEVAQAPEVALEKEKKQRKRAVVLFWIPDWPSQDPNRRMLWRICWDGEPSAQRELKRVKKHLGKDAKWEVAMMTPTQARNLRLKKIGMRDLMERARQARAS